MKSLTLMLLLLVLAVPAAAQESAGKSIPWANKFFTGSPDNPPPVILQDFGVLPKGTIKTYRFKMTNIYAVPMQVMEPKPTCNCISIARYSSQILPREVGYIDIEIDTSRAEGEKEIKLPVTFQGRDPKTGDPIIDPKTKQPFNSRADLVVRFVSRPEIEVKPGAFQFGQVPAGQTATQKVLVTYTGLQPNWKILEVGIRKELFDAEVRSVAVRNAKAAYEVTLTLKPDAPAGLLDEHIELKTNDPGAQSVVNLAVNGQVQSQLSIVGTDLLKVGGVEVNQRVERKVAVQAEKPFKIKAVEGQGDGVSVTLLPVPDNKVQVITVTFAPDKPGPIKKVLTIKTDSGKSVTLTVEGIGKEPQ
jgi:Protein of unknown function (DUF1573)